MNEINKILEAKGIDELKLNKLIEEKIKELGVSKEEAIRLIEAEMGIKEMEQKTISELSLDSKHVYLKGTVEKVFPPIKGNGFRMKKIIISDKTGTISVVVWNDKAFEVAERLQESDEIFIVNGYTKENPLTKKLELHVGKSGDLILLKRRNKTTIAEIKEGINVIDGFIVMVFEGNPIIKRCAICKQRVENYCEKHGNIAIEKHLVVKFVLDDGTGNIKVAAFDGIAEKLLSFYNGMGIEEKIRNMSNELVEVEAHVVKKGDKYKLKNVNLIDNKTAREAIEEISQSL